MFDGRWMDSNYMDWTHGGWHGFLGVNGLISIIGTAIIVAAMVALYRDWRDGRNERLESRRHLIDRTHR